MFKKLKQYWRDSFSSHPFLSAREELNDLAEDIAAARLEMLNNGATPRLSAYIDGLCKRRLEVLDRLDTQHFRLPVGVIETTVEDCDLYDMRDYNDVTPQAGSAA